MIVIIAGSRSFDPEDVSPDTRTMNRVRIMSCIETAIAESGFSISRIISGGARGPDLVATHYAIKHKIPFRHHAAKVEGRWCV